MKSLKTLFVFMLSISSVSILVPLGANADSGDRVSKMISPAFHPTNFEDPRSISEARFIFMHHKLDDKFVTGGGDVQLYALQLRYAINEQFSIIATKDGYIDFNPDGVLPKETGWADLEAGLKYVFMEDRSAGQVASFQLRYLVPTGDEEVLQGNGDGSIHPSVSAAFALCDNTTITAGTGLRIPMDSEDSYFWDVDAQIDYRIDTSSGAFYPLFGASLIHVVSDGKRLAIADEGQDLFNFGASEATGEDIVLGAAGVKYRPVDNIDLGATFQFPFDPGTGTRVIDNRWMFDISYRF